MARAPSDNPAASQGTGAVSSVSTFLRDISRLSGVACIATAQRKETLHPSLAQQHLFAEVCLISDDHNEII